MNSVLQFIAIAFLSIVAVVGVLTLLCVLLLDCWSVSIRKQEDEQAAIEAEKRREDEIKDQT